MYVRNQKWDGMAQWLGQLTLDWWIPVRWKCETQSKASFSVQFSI